MEQKQIDAQNSSDSPLLITKDMTMGEIIDKYPTAADIMQSYGLHCFGCHVNIFETLEQGSLGHGMPQDQIDNMLDELNKMAKGESVENHEPKEIGDSQLQITEIAATKLREILEKQGKSDNYIRVEVVKGGCAGYTYNMDFAKQPGPNDRIISSHGTAVIVDKDSLEMLNGVEIDYIETLQGAGFKFNNPNAKATCGCGKSYH